MNVLPASTEYLKRVERVRALHYLQRMRDLEGVEGLPFENHGREFGAAIAWLTAKHMRLHCMEPATLDRLGEICAWANSRGADDIWLEVIPSPENEELTKRLQQAGWVFRRWQAIAACNPQELSPPETPRAEMIEEPTKEYIDTYVTCSTREEQKNKAWRRFYKARFGAEKWRLFLGRVDGKPAGAASMMLVDSATNFSNCSVDPKFRCRGMQTELLNARLHYAKELGIELATVDAQPDTQSLRNIIRAGFGLAMHVTQWQKPVG